MTWWPFAANAGPPTTPVPSPPKELKQALAVKDAAIAETKEAAHQVRRSSRRWLRSSEDYDRTIASLSAALDKLLEERRRVPHA